MRSPISIIVCTSACLLLMILTAASVLADHTDLSLSQSLAHNLELKFAAKFESCSVSASRIHDAYLLEGRLVDSVLTGLESVAQDREDEKRFRNLQHRDADLKRIMNDIFNEREKKNSTKHFINDPINSLHFLIRVATKFNPILNEIFTSEVLMKRTFYQDLRATVDRMIREHSSCWPSVADVEIALRGLVTAIHTYRLPKVALLHGQLEQNDSSDSTPLSMDLMLVLTQEANRQALSDEVVDWTEVMLAQFGWDLISKRETDWRTFVRMRAAAFFKSHREAEAVSFLETQIKGTKFDVRLLKKDLKYYQNKLGDKSEESEKESKDLKTKEHQNGLCRDEGTFNSDSRLKCFYKRVLDGWYGTRVELLSIRPVVYKYYKVIKEEDILQLFDVVKTARVNTHIFGVKIEFSTEKKWRREKTVLWDDDNYIVDRMSKRISYLSALSTKNYRHHVRGSSSGPFQVYNYGLGGFSDPTVNYLDTKNTHFGGDRLATWMYQLSDNFRGGCVVFPKANLTVSFEKGSGLLWYNLYRNGTVNPNSEYMECPVISGSKWVAVKNIYENGNIFIRKCLRKMKSYF